MQRLYNKDFREVAKEMPSESVDLILTDPPYLTHNKQILTKERREKGYKKFCYDDKFKSVKNKTMIQDFFAESFRLAKKDGLLIIFLNYKRLDFFIAKAKECGWHLYYMKVWCKNNIIMNQFYTNPNTRCEYILVFYKEIKKRSNSKEINSDIVFYDNIISEKRNHPNQKPYALLEHLIKLYINNDDFIIFDAFMGGGSLGAVCKKYKNITYIGTEIDTDFFNNAKDLIYNDKINDYLILQFEKANELPPLLQKVKEMEDE